MKYLLLRQVLLALIVLSLVSGAQGDAGAKHDLTLNIRCPKKSFKQGDEIPIIFTITNNDPSPYSYDLCEHDRSGRIREYELVATYRDGTKVPDPRENYVEGLGGGLSSGLGTIATGQSYSRTIALNRWALINKPGHYTVVGTYSYSIPDPNVKSVPGTRFMRTIRVKSAPIEVVISSRGRWRMGRYIKSLVKDLKAITPSRKWGIVRQRTAIIAKLAYTCDDRIVPMLLDLMYSNYHGNEVFQAREAFLCYLPDDPKIKKVLLREAMTRGLAPGMRRPLERFGCTEQEFREIITMCLASDNLDILNEAVLAAQKHPDDAHMPQLISIAMDTGRVNPDRPSPAINRHRAIYAIACNRTDEGVKILRALLENPDEKIRRTTQDAIRWAYRRHPVYPEVPDDELTVELVPKALDTSDPMYIYAVIKICRSRTEEGVEALKILAEDPRRDIAIARTDAGVKAIRDLLRSPDEEIRERTSGLVKSIYREYPGRPLRPDDFAEELRKPRQGNRNAAEKKQTKRLPGISRTLVGSSRASSRD